MNKEMITINGLLDGISVVENNNKEETPHIPSDMLYNKNEPICFSSQKEVESFNPSLYDNVEIIYEKI